ncbi:MAG: nitrate reductase molybdenum cofactor assembly chaperone [Azospirillaceae bacterium]
MLSYKVLAALLTYPSDDLLDAARSGELAELLEAEAAIPEPARRGLHTLIADLAAGDPLDLEERYVGLFDRSRARSLHLFEHVHGDSRDRGQAMLDLHAMYEAAGLEIDGNELPDHLPVFLDYLSRLPAEEARVRLGQPIHIVGAVGRRLAERGSPYAAVFEALEALAADKPDEAALSELLEAGDDEPDDAERLDAVWEEEPVTFGPSSPGFNERPCARMARTVAEMDPTTGRAV